MTKQPKRRPRPKPAEPVEGYLTEEEITNQEAEEEDYTIPGLGKVRIRGLNRDAAHRVSNETDNRRREMIIVQEGVITPELSWQAVERWFKGPAAGQLQDLVGYLTDISGLGDKAEEEDVERFPPESE